MSSKVLYFTMKNDVEVVQITVFWKLIQEFIIKHGVFEK